MNEHNAYSINDEITLKELILKLKEFLYEIKSNYRFVLFFILIAIFIIYFNHKRTPVVYKATLTYDLHSTSSSGGSFPGILGSFGLGGGKNENLDKLMELTSSHRILKSVLFKRIKLEGQVDYIANHIIRLYDFHNTYWDENSLGSDEFYFKRKVADSASIAENKAFKAIYSHTKGNDDFKGLFSTSYSEKTGIAKIATSTLSPELSIGLTENIFVQLDSFYVKNTTEKDQLNVDILKSKTDSLYKELRSAEYGLASFKDNSLRLQRKTDLIKSAQYEGKIRMLYAALGKAIENLEIADYSLRHQTPFIQIIDRPLLPITSFKPSFKRALGFGLFFAVFISTVLIIIRKIYRDSMSDN